MPATFPAHPAAVLPLKLWRPRWFDGVALTVGSMAPDLAYALDGSPFERPFPGLPPLWQLAHSLPWFLAWALPTTLALCRLIRLAAPALATHLPAVHLPTVPPAATGPFTAALATPAAFTRLPAAHLPTAAPAATRLPSPPAAAGLPARAVAADPSAPLSRAATLRGRAPGVLAALRSFCFGFLALLRGLAYLGRGPRWYVTASSAGIGALSHVLWDRIALGPLDLASSVLGGLFCLWLLHRLARQRFTAQPPPASGGADTIPSRRPPLATPAAQSPLAAAVQSPESATVPPPDSPARQSPAAAGAQTPASPGAQPPTALPPTVLSRGVQSPALATALSPGFDSPWDDRGGRRRPILFWGTVMTVLGSGGVLMPFLPGFFLPHTTSARVILLAIAAIGIAAAATAPNGLRPLLGGRGGEPLQQ